MSPFWSLRFQGRHLFLSEHLFYQEQETLFLRFLLNDVVRANTFDVLTVSETWLDSSVSEIPGYSIFSLDRLDKVGGSVCAFVKHNLKVELRTVTMTMP